MRDDPQQTGSTSALLQRVLDDRAQSQALFDLLRQEAGNGIPVSLVLIKKLAALLGVDDDTKVLVVDPPSEGDTLRTYSRPALLVQQGAFQASQFPPLSEHLEPARAVIQRASASVGSVEVWDGGSVRYAGTAWMFAPGVAITNRHVADTFMSVSNGQAAISQGNAGPLQVRINFRAEPGAQPLPVVVTGIRKILDEDVLDATLLDVGPGAPAPLALSEATPAAHSFIVAIGHPANEPDSDCWGGKFIDFFLQGGANVKRVSPGQVTAVDSGPDQAPDRITHDCTTFAGNSGSPVLALPSGQVVGLHYDGACDAGNHAVPVNRLRHLL